MLLCVYVLLDNDRQHSTSHIKTKSQLQNPDKLVKPTTKVEFDKQGPEPEKHMEGLAEEEEEEHEGG